MEREYPPLTARHKRIFAVAAALAVGTVMVFSLARLQLIRWWIGHCEARVAGCDAVEIAFDWWWIAVVCVVAGIAFVAHWVTRDRLGPAP